MGNSPSESDSVPVIALPLEEVNNAALLNLVVAQLWKRLDEFAALAVREKVVPLLKRKLKAAKYGLLSVDLVSLGTIPLRIEGVHVYPQDDGASNITMDLDINYQGDAVVEGHLVKIPFGVKDFRVKGRVRVLLGPLKGKLPFAAVSFFFLQQPELHFDLTGLANVGDFLGIRSVVDWVLALVLEKYLIFPRRKAVIIDKKAITQEELEHPLPRGYLEVTVMGVRDVDDEDIIGKSDVFVSVEVAGQQRKTKVVENALEAEFNETFQFPLLEYEGTMVKFDVCDKDFVGMDQLGTARVNLSRLANQDEGEQMRLKLMKSRNGSVEVKFRWCSVTDDESAAGLVRADEAGDTPSQGLSIIVVVLGALKGVPIQDSYGYYATLQYVDAEDESMNASASASDDGQPGLQFNDHIRYVGNLSKDRNLQITVLQQFLDEEQKPAQVGSVSIDLTAAGGHDPSIGHTGDYALVAKEQAEAAESSSSSLEVNVRIMRMP